MKVIIVLLLALNTNLSFSQEVRETFWEKMARYHDIIFSLTMGSLDSRGLSLDSLFKPNVPSYSQVSKSINKQISKVGLKSASSDSYPIEVSSSVNSDLSYAKSFKILPNAKSFELREKLIREAKKSIYVLVWAIYDDETGFQFQNQLLDALARNPDLDIKIITDGNIVNFLGRSVLKNLETLSQGKINIMRWKSLKYKANGSHRKMFIVDQEHVIVGGMNIGNEYSHLDTSIKWRDLDLYINGKSSGFSAEKQFIEIWNKQIEEFPRLKNKMDYMEISQYQQEPQPDDIPVAFVDQHPGSAIKDYYHNIHTAVVKLFRDAKDTIDIENAYFIMDPIIKEELKKVLKRGVKVRLFTNSDKSIDEPIVSTPVMKSARDALQMGAKVYLKKKLTVHSKYMIVDGKISMIGSFNFHPRSLHFDAENVAVVFDETLARELTEHFEKGISEELHVQNAKDIKLDWTFMGLIMNSFYFDFL
jgi:cardiolipin synthase